MSAFDIIAVGNATIDIFLTISQSNNHFRFDQETEELCIKIGDKATINKADFLLGGNASNVSVGCARFGLKSAAVAEIGTDDFSEKIIKGLKKEGVEAFFKQTENSPSPFSIIINFNSERTIFCEDIQREHNFSFNKLSTKWVYLTSVSKKWRIAYENTLKFVKDNKIKLALNPGVPQLDEGFESYQEAFRESEIVFLNKEEAEKMLRTQEQEVEDLLIKAKSLGAKNIVITNGKSGSHLIDEKGEIFFEEASKSEAVERTGAGDAYSSGFMSAVISGESLQTAMRWGTCNAGAVVTKIGSQPGLLTYEEIKKC